MSDKPSSPHPSDSMRSADVANGEAPHESTPDPGREPTPATSDDPCRRGTSTARASARHVTMPPTTRRLDVTAGDGRGGRNLVEPSHWAAGDRPRARRPTTTSLGRRHDETISSARCRVAIAGGGACSRLATAPRRLDARGTGRAGCCTASARSSPTPAPGSSPPCLVVAWAVVGARDRLPGLVGDRAVRVTASVTFVMVFVIQHTQSRQTTALQRKLDELIRVTDAAADPSLIAVEEAPDEELQALADLNLGDRNGTT